VLKTEFFSSLLGEMSLSTLRCFTADDVSVTTAARWTRGSMARDRDATVAS
jgi:hypothetical protein